MPPFTSVLSGLDSAPPVLHTIYAFLAGSLLTLVGIEYQVLNTSPFKQHPALLKLFLIAIIVYAMALFLVWRTSDQNDQQNSGNLRRVLLWMCHISGTVACELLLLVLVSTIWSLVINVSSFLLVVLSLIFYNKFFAVQSSHGDTQSSQGELLKWETLRLQLPLPILNVPLNLRTLICSGKSGPRHLKVLLGANLAQILKP